MNIESPITGLMITPTERIAELEAERDRLRTSLGFFMSVIKNGEPWTDTCEYMRRKALEPL